VLLIDQSNATVAVNIHVLKEDSNFQGTLIKQDSGRMENLFSGQLLVN